MTLAALEATLSLYRDESTAIQAIPTLRMLTLPLSVIQGRAAELKARLDGLGDNRLSVDPMDLASKAGGGSLPLLNLPSRCLGIRLADRSANALEAWLRNHTPPIIGRIENDRFIIDPRTLQEEELEMIETAFAALLSESTGNKQGESRIPDESVKQGE